MFWIGLIMMLLGLAMGVDIYTQAAKTSHLEGLPGLLMPPMSNDVPSAIICAAGIAFVVAAIGGGLMAAFRDR